MQFHRTLGTPELCSGEHAQAQRDGGAVQRKQLVLESELPLPSRYGASVPVQQEIEQIPVHLPWTVRIGIGKSRFSRKILKTKMPHLPRTTGKTPAYLPDTLCLGQLTKQHGNKMSPGTVPFGMTLGIVL